MSRRPRRTPSWARRLIAVVFVGVAVSVLGASPASAHGSGGPQPTNYRTVVHGIHPRLPGVEVEDRNLGLELVLDDHARSPVTVLGYQGEPYLRIGPRGVFENVRSPAVRLNRTTTPTGSATTSFSNADAPPRWKKISDRHTARWHDHRAHWMGTSNPPIVQRDPSRAHVVIPKWSIPLSVDGRRYTVTGSVTWTPGPKPWLWILAALVGTILLVALARGQRAKRVVVTALAVFIAVTVVDAVMEWSWYDAGFTNRLGLVLYASIAAAVAAAVLVRVVQVGVTASSPLLILAGLLVLLAGLDDILVWWRSQLPTMLPAGLARASVVVAISTGLALIVIGGTRVRYIGGPVARQTHRTNAGYALSSGGASSKSALSTTNSSIASSETFSS